MWYTLPKLSQGLHALAAPSHRLIPDDSSAQFSMKLSRPGAGSGWRCEGLFAEKGKEQQNKRASSLVAERRGAALLSLKVPAPVGAMLHKFASMALDRLLSDLSQVVQRASTNFCGVLRLRSWSALARLVPDLGVPTVEACYVRCEAKNCKAVYELLVWVVNKHKPAICWSCW